MGLSWRAALALAAMLGAYALILAAFSLACALNERCDILIFFR